MSKDLLKGIRIYLSGAIEFCNNDGVILRKQFKDKCKEANLDVKFLDPTDKNDNIVGEIAEERDKLRQLKASGQFKEFTAKFKRIRRWDLRAVDLSHCFVIFIDKSVPSWGSADELKLAEIQKKPIFAVVSGGAKNCPDWVFTQIKYTEMFSSDDELVEHLKNLNDGKKRLDKRWVLIGL